MIFALFASHVSIKPAFLNILRYHISSTNIPPHLLTLKEISHYITPIWIVLPIQPHTHRLKRIISFSSHNQQSQITRMQKQRKTKYSIAETKQISSRNYTVTPKTQSKFAKTKRKYQIAEAEGKTKYKNNCKNCRNT